MDGCKYFEINKSLHFKLILFNQFKLQYTMVQSKNIDNFVTVQVFMDMTVKVKNIHWVQKVQLRTLLLLFNSDQHSLLPLLLYNTGYVHFMSCRGRPSC